MLVWLGVACSIPERRLLLGIVFTVIRVPVAVMGARMAHLLTSYEPCQRKQHTCDDDAATAVTVTEGTELVTQVIGPAASPDVAPPRRQYVSGAESSCVPATDQVRV
jgi:hypothetical protein